MTGDISGHGMLPSPYSNVKLSSSYFPSIPPKIPSTVQAYPRYVQHAPYSALTGVVVDGRTPDRFPTSARCRVRKQVGLTNRWRQPESLYSDLLGSNQAIKSINMSLNSSIMNIISAESPKLSNNVTEVNRTYSYRLSDDRPHRPVCTNYSSLSPCIQTKSSARFSPCDKDLPFSKRIPDYPSEICHFNPKIALNTSPKQIFLYHSKKALGATRPDVLFRCLKTDWELHRPFIRKAETLAKLLQDVGETKDEQYFKNLSTQELDEFICDSGYYKNYTEAVKKLDINEQVGSQRREMNDPAHYCKKRMNSVGVVSLTVTDPMVTRKALAIALGSLYTEDVNIPHDEAGSVLSAACLLGFKQLIDRCKDIILKNINYKTVCKYHKAASKYNQCVLIEACEKWLELNLISEVACQIQLRDVSLELLQKILKSNRLFVCNEYSVYKTLAYWLFFQLNPDLQLMPSHSSILSFFNSLSKCSSLIEKDEGQIYAPLFSAIRLHGITDTSNIQDMQMMNVVPQKWLVDLLSQHYNSLQGGGDMPTLKNFNQACIRYGFIIDSEPHYHSEIISLHGFHFELKAVKQGPSKTYLISLQRLKPGDPILSFRQCERHTFSMRADRNVRYNISVSYQDSNHELKQKSTDVVSQKFGLCDKTSLSEVLTVVDAEKPLYVLFSILFPTS